jgi:hypothetical protein
MLFRISAFLAFVIAAGMLLGWMATRDLITRTQPLALNEETSAPATTPASAAEENPTLAVSLTQTPPLVTSWQEKLGEVLQSDTDDAQQSKMLLELFPDLPQDGQVAVAERLSFLLPGPDYSALAEYLTNPQTPEPVLDAIMAGLLNRADSLKLPLLLELARDDQHPKATEAKELLEAMLDESYGTDWSQWQAEVDRRLKPN